MLRLALLVCLMILTGPARAEEIVLGLGQEDIGIGATFDGSDLSIFGAIARDAPAPDGDTGIIIAISGPLEPVTVRQKDRIFGIWINAQSIEVDAAPSFYAVATSGPMDTVLSNTEDLRHSITLPRMIRSVGTGVENSSDFVQALIRVRAAEELYRVFEGAVEYEAETLFQTTIPLPANLTEGTYTARIFFTRDGMVVDEYDTTIEVAKVGLERWLYTLAHEQAILYGLLSLAIAISAGWLAAAAFSVLKR